MPVSAINISFRQPDLGRTDPHAWDGDDEANEKPSSDMAGKSPGGVIETSVKQDRMVVAVDEVENLPATTRSGSVA